MGHILRLYEFVDDLQTPMVDTNNFTPKPEYVEVYANKVVYNGKEYDVFTLRPLGFYEAHLVHVPANDDYQVIDDLMRCGVMATINKKTHRLFMHNCTQNTIFITKDSYIIDE